MNPQIQAMLQQAIQAFQGKNFDSADLMLKRILSIDSKNLPALHILGLINASQSKYKEAADFLGRAVQIHPDDPSIQYNLAKALSDCGLDKDSIPHHKKAVELALDNPMAWFNYGSAAFNLGQHDVAIDCYDKALGLKSDYYDAWSNKGMTLFVLKRFDEAITCCDRLLSLRPNYADGWSNKGMVLHELKRFDEAIAHYDKALTLKPDYAEAWSSRGSTLNELKRFDEAIAHYNKALSLKPEYAEGWSNKGVTLNELGRYDEAITHYDKALSLKPEYVEGWSNKGMVLHELCCFDEAITHYDKALTLKPDYIEASWNKSLSLLLQGDFEHGLPLYENRWNSGKVSTIIGGKRFFNRPTWLGVQSLQGKKILLYGEQGLGDFIQFCRYTKLVSELGAKVILETPESLVGLMENLEGVSELLIKGKEPPLFDYQCPLLSLPLALKTVVSTIPAQNHYLTSNPNKVSEWKVKLGEKKKKRIGLVWSSMSGFKQDSKRSLMLIDFVKALPVEGFEYICLQKELKECDKEFFESYKNIRFLGDALGDFADTAALIDNLDLVISTCTSVPHLSGALGKETWVLLSHTPDWRWLLDRDDSPWYPSMQLYRQSSIGDWDGVFDKVKFDLLNVR